MPYCPRCGVEVEERLDACPLCDTRIPEEVRQRPEKPVEPSRYPEDVIPPTPMYRTMSTRQRRILTVALIIFMGVFPILLTGGIDMARNGGVTWSYYVAIPVVGAALMVWLFVRFGRRPIVSVTAAMLILMVIQLLIADRSDPGRFFVSQEFPFFVAVFALVELFLVYRVFRRPPLLRLVAFGLTEIALFLGAVNAIVSGSLSWSLITAACILPVPIYLVYLDRVKRKGLNMAGFLFLDLTIMTTGIDLAVDGGAGWSLITSLIFLTLTALFYILHVTLFDDTDWKKALHL